MSESYIQVPQDSIGKKVRTILTSIQSTDVHMEVMIAKTSGEAVTVSGNIVGITGQIDVHIMSGTVTLLSGQILTSISGQVVDISGQSVIIQSGIAVTATVAQPTGCYHEILLLGSVSGGETFSSRSVMNLTIRNWPGNGNVWIGAAGVLSGYGYLVLAGEERRVEVNNANKVYIYSEISGDRVMGLGEFL